MAPSARRPDATNLPASIYVRHSTSDAAKLAGKFMSRMRFPLRTDAFEPGEPRGRQTSVKSLALFGQGPFGPGLAVDARLRQRTLTQLAQGVGRLATFGRIRAHFLANRALDA